ncbi:MAG TPA: ammonium transporter [Anaerolineales bacterium]|nr:ammonium transporter [Anaerolineales bacterium]HRF49681.1 ammonium transporter [Anaerolineales bacterium]
MSRHFALPFMRWARWVVVPALAAVALAVFAAPALAEDPDPVAEALRGVNTSWVLIAAFLVFFMQAGFAFVEAGLTRAKNTVNILFKNLIDFVFATLAFWAIGYAFMFGTTAGGFIGTTGFLLDPTGGADVFGLPVMAFWLFQLVFAGTAATIVSGAMAERTQFVSYLIYSAVISAIIYPIAGHWLWGGGWLSTLGSLGFTDGASFRDFAGSTLVHSVGGWLALIGAMMLGPRIGRFAKDGTPKVIPGHSISLAVLGVFILWLGWFGFNPGSQLAATGANADAISLVAANTNIAAAGGAMAAMITAWIITKKPDLGQTLNGVLAGLVAITAPCAWVTPAASIVIGAVGGVIVVLGAIALERAKIDDPVSAVPVHLMNGVWGTLAVGLFATDTGLFATGSAGQLIAQIVGVLAYGAWCVVTGYALFAGIKATTGLRVSREEELKGLDHHEHGAEAYPNDILGDLAPMGGAAD